MDNQANNDHNGVGADWQSALAEQKETMRADGDPAQARSDARRDAVMAAAGRASGGDVSQVRPMRPEDFSGTETPPATDKINLEMVLDVPVTISMEIGRARIPIRNLLQLNQGSVVELDRLAGEPLSVLVNGTLIAHGEVVVVNEKFGIRLTDVISPSERIRKLK